MLAGCSTGAAPEPGPAPSASATPTVSSTVAVPDEVALTEQGSTLPFGTTARVIFESTENRGTVLGLNVLGVRRARPADFTGFILDDATKRGAAYYFARVRVRNAGRGDVGGVAVPLWGVDRDNTLLPAVNFTSPFPPCPTRRLPAPFRPGAVLDTCLVFLVPDRGPLVSVSYRPSQAFNPVVWKGAIAPPEATKKPTKKRHQEGHQAADEEGHRRAVRRAGGV